MKSRPGAQGNIHGGEIVWPDNADVGHRKIGERERRLAEKMDGGGRAQPGERRKAFHAGGADARHGVDSGEKLPEESHA